MGIYSELFVTFSKIGAFTLGGGYAMVPVMEKEIVDNKKWLTKEEFMDILVIAQSTPGLFAIDMASHIGYKFRGVAGGITAAIGVAGPSIVAILLIAMFFHQFKDVPVVAAMFRGIRPAVVALIAVPTFNLARSAKISWTNCWIPIAGALAIWLLGVSPIFIILAAGLGGWLYGTFVKPTI